MVKPYRELWQYAAPKYQNFQFYSSGKMNEVIFSHATHYFYWQKFTFFAHKMLIPFNSIKYLLTNKVVQLLTITRFTKHF